MKLSCTQNNLRRGIQLTARMTGGKISLPVLNNILLETEKGRLKFSATDLEIGITTYIGAKIQEEGAITLPSRLLVDYINANNDQTIDIELKGTNVNLTSQNYQANIKGIEAKEFPRVPKINKPALLNINALELQKGLNQVVFATTTDETRPVLTGVYCRLEDQNFKMVATDSYRLTEKTLPIEDKKDKNNKDIRFIVPSRTILELIRILNEENNQVMIFLSENQVMFKIGETELISRLIEGEFPNYQAIIPQDNQTKITTSVNSFLVGVKMASYFARESAGNVRLKITPGKLFHVKAISPQVGDEVSRVIGEVTGKEMEIAFNAKFLTDALSAIEEENVTIELGSPLSPGLIKPQKKQDYWHIIMPLKIED